MLTYKEEKVSNWDNSLVCITPLYISLVDMCGSIAESEYFNNFVTFVILVASEVGLQTDDILALKYNLSQMC